MSSDTVKENTSPVYSSVSECRNEKVNSYHSESPRDRVNDEACRSGAEDRAHYCDQMVTSSQMQKDRLCSTRYFIIKSLNLHNIELSIKKGIWATQVMNEPILEEAFQNSGKVILIFSVNMSGFFQGYAQMTSSVGWRRDNIWNQAQMTSSVGWRQDNIWNQGHGKNNPWGRSFRVKWLRLYDLPFQKTLHLKNPWNDYKPVKISRDCQELPQDIGEALCELLDEGDNVDLNLKRDEVSMDVPTRRLYVEPSHSVQDEDLNFPSMNIPMVYPSLFYHHHHQAEASGFPISHQSASVLLDSSVVSGSSKVKQSKRCRLNGSMTSKMDKYSPFNMCDLSTDRIPHTSTLTEDDLLEMTYEEYLEAHAMGSRRLRHCVPGPSQSLPKSSTSTERSDDSQSGSSRKRSYF